MPLARLKAPFDHPDWTFELKYDGFRALAYVDEACRLVSRRRHVFKQFDALCRALRAAVAGSAVIDGEVVCLDAQGRPRFNDLLCGRGEPVFTAFDLLWLDGEDLRGRPLVERKQRLRELIPARSPRLLYVQDRETRGAGLYELVCKMDLEGIVAKRRQGLYTPESTSWVKIKNPSYSQAEGRGELFERRASAAR